jgi:ATP-binding cassette subfamily B protein AbcA/BmrA
LCQALQQHGVNVLWLTVGLFNQYAQALAPVLPRLRYLIVGGDALDAAVVRRVLADSPPQQLINGYGPTESTVFALTHAVHDVPQDAHSVPIGRPIANTRVYLLDERGRPVPVGVAGEIHIAGDGLALGYLNRPELTAQRFVADPFHGGRMYRTGDLGRYRTDGVIEFLGRNDHQVKLRGYRIELGEIEAQLRQQPGIRDAVVVVREDSPGDRRLVAYCCADAGQDAGQDPCDAQALRAALSDQLPEYMLPAAFVRLQRLPLTPNGKLDRRALPPPDAHALAQRGYEAPRGGLEAVIAQAWSEVLQLERIGRHDHFFDLGGHSLMMPLVVSLLRRRQIRLGMTDLFQHPTVESLARHLALQSPRAQEDEAVPVRPQGRQRPLFLVHDFHGMDSYFATLAPHIDADIPVYGLPSVPPGGPLPRSMQELAARLVRMIRRVQPDGPVRVAGWSFGGLVAYEIGAQLLARGEAVECIGVLDTLLRRPDDDRLPRRDYSPQQMLMLACEGVARADPPATRKGRALSRRRIAAFEEIDRSAGTLEFEDLLGRCAAAGILPGELHVLHAGEARHHLARMLAHQLAMENYEPPEISAEVHLIIAEEELTEGEDPQRGWGRIVPPEKLRIQFVPGDHLSMMTVHTQALGNAMTHALTPAASPQPLPAPDGPAPAAGAQPAAPTQSYADLWRLVEIARPSGLLLSLAALTGLIAAAGSLWFPLLTGDLVDQLGAGTFSGRTVATLTVVLLVAGIVSALSNYLLSRVGVDVVAALRNALTAKLIRLPVARFDENNSGECTSRVINDCKSISELVTSQAVGVLGAGLTLVGSVVVLLVLDARLTLMLLAAVAGAFAVILPVSLLLNRLSQQVQDHTARLSGILTSVFSEIRLVKAFTAERRERARSEQEVAALRRLEIRAARISAALQPVTGIALTAAVIAILVYGASRMASGNIGVGTLTAFILYIFNIAVPLTQLTVFMAELQEALGASSRISALLQQADEEDRPGSRTDRPAGGVLEFRNVSFAYQAEAPVLRGIDLVFRPGTTTALVGVSGSGKTTILSLIERFYQPTGGDILYGGEPVTAYSLEAWRGGIGYVAQSAPIMPGSVRDNITYGLAGSFTDEQVRAAARKAGALPFIESMPQGLDSILIEQGNNVSGGQRQRLAIARMFLRDPEILILDEATSSLDSETEHQVKTALVELMRGRTNIIVAHRLFTIMHTERIYFLEDGRISGSGNHGQLLQTHPYYARLVERQFNLDDHPGGRITPPALAEAAGA